MKHGDEGFTLIELLISVVLVGVIVTAVSGGLVVLFATTTETTDRLSESPDLQKAAAYFGSDGQSATSFDKTCGPLAATATRAVSFSWTDPGADPAAPTGDTGRKVSYVVEPVGAQKQLVRYACVVPASGAETVDRTVVVDYLRPTTTPAATCTLVSSGASVACNGVAAGAAVDRVELLLSICTADASLACRNDPLDFALRADGRAW